jgi:hypothetical protein
MPADWSKLEVEAVTADYIAMLLNQLRHQPYSKTDHRRLLAQLLENRSDGSIERKHQNISAVLISIGYPYISGYKPLGNYQRLLAEVVTDRVVSDQVLAAVVREAVGQPAIPPSVENILAVVENAPESAAYVYHPAAEQSAVAARRRPPVNYLERESNNSSLGRAGEEFALSFERARLISLGKNQLAERVEHISITEGDGSGFDIRSFEAGGSDRFIEVKTTAYGKMTPFFVSRNEVSVSAARGSRFHLYRLFEFRDDARLYMLNGSLREVCLLEPVQFAARPANDHSEIIVTGGLPRLLVKRLVGHEPFTNSGHAADFDISTFWQWASSDLVTNVARGLLAEYLVAKALGLDDGVRDPWQPYDLKTQHGLTLEIKSSAYLQSWWQHIHSEICFSISETRSWSADTNELSPTQQRQAHAYVFALLSHRDKATLNPLELTQWEFYLVPTSTISERVGSRKQLTMKALLELQPKRVPFSGLLDAIRTLERELLPDATRA